MTPDNVVWLGAIASLLAGLGTGVGSLPIFFIRNLTNNLQGALLGFGAGVMLAASAFSLIIPGVEAAREIVPSEFGAAIIVALGVILGAGFLWLSNRYFPHEHFIKGPEGSNLQNLKRIWLFIIAITIHNFPEGLAVGVGFGGGNISNGIALATGIGLQNMPEGLVVALSLLTERYSRWTAFGISLVTGLVEPVGGLLGAAAVSIAQPILPWGMGFAAGAMLYVISDEIIPESNRLGHEQVGTAGLMAGFIIMMVLDVALG
jgi:ZIP family zinc transporter